MTGKPHEIYEVKEFPIKEKKEDSPKGLEGSEEWEDGTEEMYDKNYRKYLQEMGIENDSSKIQPNNEASKSPSELESPLKIDSSNRKKGNFKKKQKKNYPAKNTGNKQYKNRPKKNFTNKNNPQRGQRNHPFYPGNTYQQQQWSQGGPDSQFIINSRGQMQNNNGPPLRSPFHQAGEEPYSQEFDEFGNNVHSQQQYNDYLQYTKNNPQAPH